MEAKDSKDNKTEQKADVRRQLCEAAKRGDIVQIKHLLKPPQDPSIIELPDLGLRSDDDSEQHLNYQDRIHWLDPVSPPPILAALLSRSSAALNLLLSRMLSPSWWNKNFLYRHGFRLARTIIWQCPHWTAPEKRSALEALRARGVALPRESFSMVLEQADNWPDNLASWPTMRKTLCKFARAGDGAKISAWLSSVECDKRVMGDMGKYPFKPTFGLPVFAEPFVEEIPLFLALEAPDANAFISLLPASKRVLRQHSAELVQRIALRCCWPVTDKIKILTDLAPQGIPLEPVHLAALAGDVNYLKQHPQELEKRGNEGYTVAHFATASGQLPILDYLYALPSFVQLSSIADIPLPNLMPLFLAIHSNQPEAVVWWLEPYRKPSLMPIIDSYDAEAQKFFEELAKLKNSKTVKWLIAKWGIDPGGELLEFYGDYLFNQQILVEAELSPKVIGPVRGLIEQYLFPLPIFRFGGIVPFDRAKALSNDIEQELLSELNLYRLQDQALDKLKAQALYVEIYLKRFYSVGVVRRAVQKFLSENPKGTIDPKLQHILDKIIQQTQPPAVNASDKVGDKDAKAQPIALSPSTQAVPPSAAIAATLNGLKGFTPSEWKAAEYEAYTFFSDKEQAQAAMSELQRRYPQWTFGLSETLSATTSTTTTSYCLYVEPKASKNLVAAQLSGSSASATGPVIFWPQPIESKEESKAKPEQSSSTPNTVASQAEKSFEEIDWENLEPMMADLSEEDQSGGITALSSHTISSQYDGDLNESDDGEADPDVNSERKQTKPIFKSATDIANFLNSPKTGPGFLSTWQVENDEVVIVLNNVGLADAFMAALVRDYPDFTFRLLTSSLVSSSSSSLAARDTSYCIYAAKKVLQVSVTSSSFWQQSVTENDETDSRKEKKPEAKEEQADESSADNPQDMTPTGGGGGDQAAVDKNTEVAGDSLAVKMS